MKQIVYRFKNNKIIFINYIKNKLKKSKPINTNINKVMKKNYFTYNISTGSGLTWRESYVDGKISPIVLIIDGHINYKILKIIYHL